MRLKYLFLVFLIAIVSCDDEDKTTQIYSYPEWQREVFLENIPPNSTYLFNLGNPSKGLFPTQVQKREGLPKALPNKLNIGGKEILKKYLDILRERLGNKVQIIGHSGLSNENKDQSKKDLILKSLKEFNLDAILLSKGDLPAKGTVPSSLYKNLPWYNTNILSITTGDPTNMFASEPYKLISSINLGLIGVTSYQMLSSKERNEISGFYFQDPVTSVLRYKNTLSKNKDSLVVLYFNGPVSCKKNLPINPIPFEKLPAFAETCPESKDLLKILKRLPPKAIDLVVTNSSELAGALYQGQIPIIGSVGSPLFLSGVRLTRKNDTLSLQHSLVLPPIKLCHKMFAGTQDCLLNGVNEDIDEDRYDLMEKSGHGFIPARFLGKEIKP